MSERNRGSKDGIPLPESEIAALERFFRGNIRQIVSTTEQWFSLPNIAKELIEKEGLGEVLARKQSGVPTNPLDALIGEDVQGFINETLTQISRLGIEENSPMQAIDYANARLEETDQRFSGNDLRLARYYMYRFRGRPQGHMVEHGPLKDLPTGNKLRSLCCLSSATDFMRADIEYGSVTDLSKTTSECFGYAEMPLLQYRVLEKYFGRTPQILYRSGRPMERLSVPQDREIADLQRRLVNKLQRIM